MANCILKDDFDQQFKRIKMAPKQIKIDSKRRFFNENDAFFTEMNKNEVEFVIYMKGHTL